MNIYLRILSFAKPYKTQIVLYTVTAVIGVMCIGLSISLLAPVLELLFSGNSQEATQATPDFFLNLKVYFNNFLKSYLEQGDQHSALLFAIGAIVGISLLGNGFRYLSNVFMAIIRTKTLEDVRNFIFSKINDLHIGYFEGERKGDIMTRLTSDVYEVERSVVATFQSLVRDPLTVIFYLILMIYFSWQLTLFIFIVLPVAATFIGLLSGALRKDAYQTQDRLSWIMSIIEEVTSGMRIIKAFNAEGYVKRVFAHYNKGYSYYSRKQFVKKGLVQPFSESMGIITIGIILWYGGGLVFDGAIQASSFLTYIFFFQQIMKPAKSISNAFANINRGIASGERIFGVIDAREAIEEKTDALAVPEFKEKLDFINVGFAYTEEKVLDQINLTVEKGQVIALVGPSGSGKTTLAEMIPRFYDPIEGRIELDGHDLKDFQLKPLRELIGLVTQEPILFNDTIFNNIAFGSDNAKEADVIAAAKVANAHDFIMEIDNGYHSHIGDRGVLLSGGQRQRLSIARAIFKNPPIMIFDEATSSLDSASEKMVQEALHQLMKNRTSVVIAHRLSTVKEADQIIVMDKGHIVQRGTHSGLLEEEGVYRSLYQMQQLGD